MLVYQRVYNENVKIVLILERFWLYYKSDIRKEVFDETYCLTN